MKKPRISKEKKQKMFDVLSYTVIFTLVFGIVFGAMLLDSKVRLDVFPNLRDVTPSIEQFITKFGFVVYYAHGILWPHYLVASLVALFGSFGIYPRLIKN